MLENISTILGSIVTALGGLMTTMDIVFDGCGIVRDWLERFGQFTSRICNKFILCQKKKFVALPISHVCLYMEKKLKNFKYVNKANQVTCLS